MMRTDRESCGDVAAAMRSVEGTAHSMGVDVI
jgi:ribosomal protein L11